MNDKSEDYRNLLIQADQRSLESYDRNLLSLSGGALAITITFVDKIIGTGPIQLPYLLILSWACWIATLGGTITSFYFSHLALRRAIKQVDEGTKDLGKIGGRFSGWVKGLNAINGILFIAGLILIAIFAKVNL